MTPSEKSPSTTIAYAHNALVAFCALGTALLIGWLLKYSAYGIDFTDESFYLVWIANPFLYDVSVFLFGFVYHPIYKLLGGNIAAIRRANILITYSLAWCFTYTYLASLAPQIKENRVTLLTVAAGLATSAFILFDYWIPTPSYNSLALQALLVSAIGLVLAEKTTDRTSIIGWVLIGLGGWLAFMAKPSTALALVIAVLIYLPLSRKFSIRMLAISAVSATAPLLASMLLIDGSVMRFIERLQLGIEFIEYLGGGHTPSQILRIDKFQLNKKLALAILCVSGALFVALWSMWAKNKKWSFIGPLISIAFFAITALLTLNKIHWVAELGQFQGLLIFALVYAVAITALVLGRFKVLKTITASQWAIASFFLATPHIYAFGTNNNYWSHGSRAAIFWLLAGLTLLGPLIRQRASWFLMLPIALAAQAVTATLLQTGLEQPYRQPQPLRLNASTLEIGKQRSALVLSSGYAEYIASAVAAAQNAGFEPNTAMIDLTGQSPGILYALNAQSIGQPWTLGGYPGSLAFVRAGLSRFSCEDIANAWVLFESDGPLKIPTELMVNLGADFPGAYKQVGTWQTAAGAGGYTARRTQELYKPVKPQETLMNCQMLRQKLQKKASMG